MNKNIHFNLTIVIFSSCLTSLLAVFSAPNRVSLAHDKLYTNDILENNDSPAEESLSESILFQELSPEKLNFESQLWQNINNPDIFFNIPTQENTLTTVSKSDFYLPEEEVITEPNSITKTISNSNYELVLTKTLELIREFEGFRAQAYQDTDGTPIIGYGLSKIAGKKVQMGDRISTHQAEAALKAEVHAMQKQIKSIVKVQLNPYQLGALTSFAFNTGFYSLKKSTLLRKLNAGDHYGAANEFLRWNKAHSGGRLVPMAGLTRRRKAEKQLFLTGPTL